MSVTKFALLICVCILISSAAFAAGPPLISYQGKLLQTSGSPVPDGTYSVQFSIYTGQTGGTPLWSEVNSSVVTSGGLFSVLLGSVVNLPANIFSSSSLWFGVTVGTDPEMTPRQQIASVAFAFNAATADSATTVPSGTITSSMLAPGLAIPSGIIVMWSGQASQIPTGWVLCNGLNGTPNLEDMFVVGAGNSYLVGATGGATTHTLAMTEMPSHTHTLGDNVLIASTTTGQNQGWGWELGQFQSGQTTGAAGGDPVDGHTHAFSILPPYYALCYIMKQ